MSDSFSLTAHYQAGVCLKDTLGFHLTCEFVWFQLLEVALQQHLVVESGAAEVGGDEVRRAFVWGAMRGSQCPLCVGRWWAGDVMAGRTRSLLSV